MSYKPSATEAFASVEYIMRDVNWGWLIRYMHSTGASFFFILVYLHMFRGLMWGSYKKPRELLWIIGVVIYLAMMATAFFGYLLPWGQMSYWGAQVIVNLFAAVPGIGEDLSVWVRGDYVISDVTLNRFFAFHFLIAVHLAALVFLHIVALHTVGSTNPDGIEIKKGRKDKTTRHPADGIPFHPYYTVKDIVGLVVFLAIFSAVVFYAPDFGGLFLEAPNFQPADPLKTPSTSRRSGTSRPTTRCCVRCRRSPVRSSPACWSCSAPSASCSCCPGWIAARCARCATRAVLSKGFFLAPSRCPSSCLPTSACSPRATCTRCWRRSSPSCTSRSSC
jgi:hypothetical protein